MNKKTEKILSNLNKKYGQNTIYRFGDSDALDIDRFSSGSLSLDMKLGGGIPRGRIIEVFGMESSGKTTLSQHIIAEDQKLGNLCAFVDMENALDITYAEACGVDIDGLYISQPDYGEQALDITKNLIESGQFGTILVDSVASLVPKAVLEGDPGDAHIGLLARMMSQNLAAFAPLCKRTNTTLLFTNQMRSLINAMGFGPKKTTSGGNALKFYASLRLELARIKTVKDTSGEAIANLTKIKVKKSKVSKPFVECEVHIKYGEGISKMDELLDLGLEYNIFDKSGSYYYYMKNEAEETKAQGRGNFIETLKRLPEESLDKIKDKVLGKINELS